MGIDGRKTFARGGRGANVLPGLHWRIDGGEGLRGEALASAGCNTPALCGCAGELFI